MKTELLAVDDFSLKKAEALLRSGQVVAFPTETVYGLGAWAFSVEGIDRVYEAKGRPSDNPLIVHVAPGMDLSKIVTEIPEKGRILMERYWPGPLTLILPKTEHVPLRVTGGLSTVAVRMPSHPAAMKLIGRTGLPIVAPSANTSGRPSPTSAQHVLEDLQGKIPLILDGGDCQVGLESTIVDLTEKIPMILRPGAITLAMLEEAVGEVDVDPAVRAAAGLNSDLVPKAPGMKYRHYAPKGYLILTDREPEQVADFIRQDLAEKEQKIGLIGSDEWIRKVENALDPVRVTAVSLGTGSAMDEIARKLFDGLRKTDEEGLERIYGEAFQRKDLGEAIMNRFLKAASERRISEQTKQ
ncbi:MAG: threonylcarbamoyl-AMP synthase [Firmicutes bacterium]|nr:threonylcarbamoyl-AMP synthase [Bacillota bacterium]